MGELSLGNETARLNPNLRDGNTQFFDKNDLALKIQNSGVEQTAAMNLASRVEGDVAVNGGTVSPRDNFVVQPSISPVSAPRSRGTISAAFGDLGAVQADVISKAAPYVRCTAEPSGRIRFRTAIPVDAASVGLNDADLRFIKERVSDTNALIDSGALGVDQFGNLTLLDSWQQKMDEYYLGFSLPAAGIVTGVSATADLGKAGKVDVQLIGTIFYFCFDDKATDRIKTLLLLGTIASALAAEFGIPLVVAGALLTARLGVGAADLVSDFFFDGGFCFAFPPGLLIPRPSL